MKRKEKNFKWNNQRKNNLKMNNKMLNSKRPRKLKKNDEFCYMNTFY